MIEKICNISWADYISYDKAPGRRKSYCKEIGQHFLELEFDGDNWSKTTLDEETLSREETEKLLKLIGFI